jgi:hypothetical protein
MHRGPRRPCFCAAGHPTRSARAAEHDNARATERTRLSSRAAAVTRGGHIGAGSTVPVDRVGSSPLWRTAAHSGVACRSASWQRSSRKAIGSLRPTCAPGTASHAIRQLCSVRHLRIASSSEVAPYGGRARGSASRKARRQSPSGFDDPHPMALSAIRTAQMTGFTIGSITRPPRGRRWTPSRNADGEPSPTNPGSPSPRNVRPNATDGVRIAKITIQHRLIWGT